VLAIVRHGGGDRDQQRLVRRGNHVLQRICEGRRARQATLLITKRPWLDFDGFLGAHLKPLFLANAATLQHVLQHDNAVIAHVGIIEAALPRWLHELSALKVTLAILSPYANPKLKARTGDVLVFVNGALDIRIAAPVTVVELLAIMNDQVRAEWERKAIARVKKALAGTRTAPRSSKKTPRPQSAFDVLGLPNTASADEIQRRFRQLALKNSPDLVASLDPCFGELATERMKAFEEARRNALARLKKAT
jgi:hypothetical protein